MTCQYSIKKSVATDQANLIAIDQRTCREMQWQPEASYSGDSLLISHEFTYIPQV